MAEATRDPHSSSSLLVSSLCTKTSMKHKDSLCSLLAVAIASINSCSVRTWKDRVKIEFTLNSKA